MLRYCTDASANTFSNRKHTSRDMNRKLLNSELERLTGDEFKKSRKNRFAIVLDNVRSMHNVGSAFRTADAFRAEKIVICGISATPPSPEIHKVALGAEFTVDWEYFRNTEDALTDLKEKGYTTVAVEQAENSVSLEKFIPEDGKKYAFIFGHEVKGVAQKAVDAADIVLEIPQFGTKHSLNVSVSLGVVMWDFVSKSPDAFECWKAVDGQQ